jgi:hypothetical protein
LQQADGQTTRPIDVHYGKAALRQQDGYRQMLLYGTPIAAACLVAGQFVPLLLPLVLVGHMVATRLILVRGPRRLMGTARRFFTRWIGRLCFLSWGGLGYIVLGAVPIAGPLAGLGTYLGLTAVLHHYTSWSLRRERERQPLAFWEKLLLAILAMVVMLMVAVMVVLALALGWVLTKVPALWTGGH